MSCSPGQVMPSCAASATANVGFGSISVGAAVDTEAGGTVRHFCVGGEYVPLGLRGDLGREVPGLPADAGPGHGPVARIGLVIGPRLDRGADRGENDGGPPPAERGAGKGCRRLERRDLIVRPACRPRARKRRTTRRTTSSNRVAVTASIRSSPRALPASSQFNSTGPNRPNLTDVTRCEEPSLRRCLRSRGDP